MLTECVPCAGFTWVAVREDGRKLLGVSPGGSQELQSRQRKKRAVAEAGSHFLLCGGNELLRYGVRAKKQTQVGLAPGITAASHLSWSGRGIVETLIASISSLKMVKKQRPVHSHTTSS